ncbi:TlpA family protein disulfide reductase [Pseudomonadota bacterium]
MKRLFLLLVTLCLTLLTVNGIAANNSAPDINLPTINGEVNLVQLEGKVVYLDFWASWCVPCRDSFPWMVEMKEKYGALGLEIVTVNLDKERVLADKFLKDIDVNFILAFDPSGDSAVRYDLRGMPGSYLIGRDGSIQVSHLGFRDTDKHKLEAVIKILLLQQ